MADDKKEANDSKTTAGATVASLITNVIKKVTPNCLTCINRHDLCNNVCNYL